MLLYTKLAAPKAPKRRSRAGCISCKEKKKKCNEERPRCDRCTERRLQCEYEAVKPRKRRRPSYVSSALSNGSESPRVDQGRWLFRFGNEYNIDKLADSQSDIYKWEIDSEYQASPTDASPLDWQNGFDSDNKVEEVVRFEPLPAGTHVRSRSQYPDLAMIAPSPVASPLLEFCAPVFMEFSDMRNRRALVDHFCNVLSHLIVFKEDTGNPFRQLVLPLSHEGSPVLNAIYALSSAHLEYRGIGNQERSLDFHNQALQGLTKLINQNEEAHREEVLGAIMLLVYFEVLVQRGNSNIVNGHLKGAMTIMKSGPQISSPTGLFLEHAFRFYDVIAALSFGTAPNAETESTTPLFPFNTFNNLNSPLSSVDTLLGLSTDLWPIIHRLSHLLSFKKSFEIAMEAGETGKATVLRTELQSTSQAIEIALENWKPKTTNGQKFSEELEDTSEKLRMQTILNNAEAYRQSAFVYLYRTIYRHPRSHSLVQKHSHLSLFACSRVVIDAESGQKGPMAALLWPLFVAACEAISEEDRELATTAFIGTEKRQGMSNIMRGWEVVQEVWRRADLAGGSEVDWRNICEEMGYNIVFG